MPAGMPQNGQEADAASATRDCQLVLQHYCYVMLPECFAPWCTSKDTGLQVLHWREGFLQQALTLRHRLSATQSRHPYWVLGWCGQLGLEMQHSHPTAQNSWRLSIEERAADIRLLRFEPAKLQQYAACNCNVHL